MGISIVHSLSDGILSVYASLSSLWKSLISLVYMAEGTICIIFVSSPTYPFCNMLYLISILLSFFMSVSLSLSGYVKLNSLKLCSIIYNAHSNVQKRVDYVYKTGGKSVHLQDSGVLTKNLMSSYYCTKTWGRIFYNWQSTNNKQKYHK